MRIYFLPTLYCLSLFGAKAPFTLTISSSSTKSPQTPTPLTLALKLEKTREKIESKGWLRLAFVKAPSEHRLFHQPFSAEAYTKKGLFIACAGFVTGRNQECVARLARALTQSNELAKHAKFFEKKFNQRHFAGIKRRLIKHATKDLVTKYPKFLGQALRCRTTIVLAKKSPGMRMTRYPQEKEGWKYGLCFTAEQESIFKELCHLTHKKKLANGKIKIGRGNLLKRQRKAAAGFYGNCDPENLSPRALVPVLVQLSNRKIEQHFAQRSSTSTCSSVPLSDSVPQSLATSSSSGSYKTRASSSPRFMYTTTSVSAKL